MREKPTFDDRWHRPTEEFTGWWRGHPEAGREYVDEETGKTRWHGISDITAWNCDRYKQEFREVKAILGFAPPREPLLKPGADEVERNRLKMRELYGTIAGIGRPIKQLPASAVKLLGAS